MVSSQWGSPPAEFPWSVKAETLPPHEQGLGGFVLSSVASTWKVPDAWQALGVQNRITAPLRAGVGVFCSVDHCSQNSGGLCFKSRLALTVTFGPAWISEDSWLSFSRNKPSKPRLFSLGSTHKGNCSTVALNPGCDLTMQIFFFFFLLMRNPEGSSCEVA